jgi:NTE family protein
VRERLGGAISDVTISAPLDTPPRIAVVLSAGGLRGAAHVGVLRALMRGGVPVDVLVGVSAGAVIAAYYAAAGLTLDQLADDAVCFRGRHLLLHSLNVRLGHHFDRTLAPRCGIIPERLRRLESATFDNLHHGICALGIVCHDVVANLPRYFATGATHGVPLPDVVKASASMPVFFPKVPVACGAERWLLTDGGVSDPVPAGFARASPLNATHVIVSDARWIGTTPRTDDRTVWLRPHLPGTGTLWTRRGLTTAVRCGDAAVTADRLGRIRSWLR